MPETLASTAQHDDIAVAGGNTLRVVLVNNMADAALAITERRFQRLLQAAWPGRPIDFRCVTLPSIPRDEMAAARITRHYLTIDALLAAPPDAMLFSGAEPLRASLRNEVFWPGLTELFDWTVAKSIPSLFSCLAAHAAVLHFAGIERRRRPQKIFGVFAQQAATDHALLQAMPQKFAVAHSRWNDVCADDLAAGGYQVLTQGAAAGVDMFVPACGAPQIFLQGHPEYEETALLGEYNRDLRRFESGLAAYRPVMPAQEDGRGAPLGGFEAVLRNWMPQKKEMVG
jgi:homoserine O-succinyltransferase